MCMIRHASVILNIGYAKVCLSLSIFKFVDLVIIHTLPSLNARLLTLNCINFALLFRLWNDADDVSYKLFCMVRQVCYVLFCDLIIAPNFSRIFPNYVALFVTRVMYCLDV